jgi:transposase InsO family protein
MAHANAKLGPAGRLALVQLMIFQGKSERQAAACLSVSSCTAHRWKRRWLDATSQERASGAWAADRSSRPHRSPRRSPAELERRVCEERERTGWGPRLIAGQLNIPHATVHRILRRNDMSRVPRPPKDEVRRFEWPCPGDLLQMDVKRFARFTRPGHRVTGDRHRTGAEKRAGVGWEFCHSIVDDHTRIAYTELHADEKAPTVTAFVERALAFYAALEITPRRLQTDNAFTYVHNRSLRELLAQRGIQHRRIPPRTPKRNGKVERYQQTLAREWAYGQRYLSSDARASALPHWLEHYNHRRPHSGIGNATPISRAHNLPRQNS